VTSPLSYQPAELVPPGQTLADWLARVGMTQAEFAKRTSLTPKHINQVVNGGVGISAEVALAFERVTSIPARYWAQLDANYQTARQRVAEADALTKHLHLVDLFPVGELERRHAIKRVPTRLEKLREVLRFFGVADPEALQAVWLQPALYRRAKAFESNQASLATWLRLAEIEASNVTTRPFDPSSCKAALSEMRALSTLPGIEWVEPLKDLAASVGIALLIIKELPKCRVNGATRWLSPDKAMVVLSLRHRRNDIFWFTLFHELCHVLRHSKKETFVDVKDSGIAEELEREADAFASRLLIPPQYAVRLAELTTASDVLEFASEVGVAPGIVVGRMQHDGYIPHSKWSSMFDRYQFSDD